MTTINDSREEILARINKAKPTPRALPEIRRFDIPGHALQNFVAHLRGFDGDFQLFASRSDATKWLRNTVIAHADGKKIFSAVPDVTGNCSVANFNTPAEMNVVDICIASAKMAVGETGSLLVDTLSLGAPAAALFSTDLFLLIDRNKLVEGLQDAYAQIDFTANRYTTFFSGPSATADIEAVHITGAQGEISLTALIYNCSEADRREVDEITNRMPQGTPLGQPDAPTLSLKRETDPSKGQDSV